MPENELRPICPIMTYKIVGRCQFGECAWWLKGDCAVKIIAEAVDELYGLQSRQKPAPKPSHSRLVKSSVRRI